MNYVESGTIKIKTFCTLESKNIQIVCYDNDALQYAGYASKIRRYFFFFFSGKFYVNLSIILPVTNNNNSFRLRIIILKYVFKSQRTLIYLKFVRKN